MLQYVFEAVGRTEKNAPFPLPTVAELLSREFPRYSREITHLKKKLEAPRGRTARIWASFAWISQEGHVEMTLQHIRHFQTALNMALTTDNMYVSPAQL